MTQNQIAFYRAKEERRHNVRTEGQTDTSIAETVRHNKQSEAINWYSAKSSAAVGFAQAAAAQAQAAAANKQADVAARNADIYAQKVEYDYAVGRDNNLNNYSKIVATNQLNWANLNETHRHNKMTEATDLAKVSTGLLGSMMMGGAKFIK